MNKEGMIKHREVLNAWLEGAEVQCRDGKGYLWWTNSEPQWDKSIEYRIKPAPIKRTVTGWFNVYGGSNRIYLGSQCKCLDEANSVANKGARIACIKHTFEFEEGEGL